MGSKVGSLITSMLPAIAGSLVLGPAGLGLSSAAWGGALGGAAGGALSGKKNRFGNALMGGLSGYGAGGLTNGVYNAGSALAKGASLGDAFTAGFPETSSALSGAWDGVKNLGSDISDGVGNIFGTSANLAGDSALPSGMELGGALDTATGLANNSINPFTNAAGAAQTLDTAQDFGGPSASLGNFINTGSTLSGATDTVAGGGGGGSSSFGNLGLGSILSGASGLLNSNTISNSEDDLKKAAQQNQQQIAPYMAAGGAGASNLQDLLTNGSSAITDTPGYKFQLQQGNNALNNQLSASGMQDSGAALKAAQQFGQGLAGTYYQNAINNNMNAATQVGLPAAGANAQYNNDIGNVGAAAGVGQNNNLLNTLAQLFGKKLGGINAS